MGSEEKYSCARALDADILSDGISCRILLARSPALSEGESLQYNHMIFKFAISYGNVHIRLLTLDRLFLMTLVGNF